MGTCFWQAGGRKDEGTAVGRCVCCHPHQSEGVQAHRQPGFEVKGWSECYAPWHASPGSDRLKVLATLLWLPLEDLVWARQASIKDFAMPISDFAMPTCQARTRLTGCFHTLSCK